MQAVIVREHGGLDALLLESLPKPKPGPGEVRVRVEACAVNHLDLWLRKGVEGHRFPLPLIPGNDVAGIVDACGVGAENMDLGAPICVAPGVGCGRCAACDDGRDHHCSRYGILGETRDGGYAEYVLVPRRNVLPRPENLSPPEAASALLAPLTAWNMVVNRAQLQPGEWILIQAAGSGVSSAAIQIAALRQARIIAVAGSAQKLERAKSLGAQYLIHHGQQDVAKEVRAITQKKGVAVAIDHVGEATWDTTLRCLGWQGRLVVCGATTGAKATLDLRHLFFKQWSILGSTMGPRADVRRVLDLYASGDLKPLVEEVLPLHRAQEAHRRLEERSVFGKLVLTPQEEQA